MVNKTFTVATGLVDDHGDKIILSGIKIPQKTIPIIYNFDHTKLLGYVDSYEIKESEFIVTAALKKDAKVEHLHPCIGFNTIKSRIDNDGIQVLDEIKLWCIGLCDSKNVDPNINPLEP